MVHMSAVARGIYMSGVVLMGGKAGQRQLRGLHLKGRGRMSGMYASGMMHYNPVCMMHQGHQPSAQQAQHNIRFSWVIDICIARLSSRSSRSRAAVTRLAANACGYDAP